MKFKYCGDLDTPDWVLAQVAQISKLTSIKMKLLCNEIVSDLTNQEINFEKLEKLTTDAKFDVEDVKSAASALRFIFSSAIKYLVDSETLANELQQLGLPKEHTQSLCKVYSENFDRLQSELKSQSLRTSRLISVKHEIVSDFESPTHLVNTPVVKLTLQKEDGDKQIGVHSVLISAEKLAPLIYELKQAQQLINEMTHSTS